MSQYKLYFFDARGSTEYIRLMLSLAGVEYEDYRMDREKEWPSLKPCKISSLLRKLLINFIFRPLKQVINNAH